MLVIFKPRTNCIYMWTLNKGSDFTPFKKKKWVEPYKDASVVKGQANNQKDGRGILIRNRTEGCHYSSVGKGIFCASLKI